MYINNLKLFVNNIYREYEISAIDIISSEKLDKNNIVYKILLYPKNEIIGELKGGIEKYFAISISDTALHIREITENKELEFIDNILKGQ